MPRTPASRTDPRLLTPLIAVILICLDGAFAAPGDLITFRPFEDVSPQDIARSSDGSYWVTNFLRNTIHHYSADLSEELDVFPSPFANVFLTGIAYNSLDDTLLVTEGAATAIQEIALDGTPTGRVIPLELERVANARGIPTARGMAFYENGDGGNGSVFLVESLGTLIYEISLDGRVLQKLEHPDDPDGFPGEGASARATDIALELDDDGEIEAMLVTGALAGVARILRLRPDGQYTGLSVNLLDASGTVSGLLRQRVEHPETGEDVDSYVCVVESNARFALLEGGEPSVPELFGLQCEVDGHRVDLEWQNQGDYDSIEVLSGCEVVATVGGDAVSWSTEFATDGVRNLSLRATLGAVSLETPSCRVVLGAGSVLASFEFEADRPIDLAWNGDDLILVSDAFLHQVHIFDLDYNSVGLLELPLEIAEEDEALTGIARGLTPDNFFVYNTSRHLIAVVDLAGEVERVFVPELPDLSDPDVEPLPGEEPEPDFGVVVGMTLNPTGDGGRGSLFIVEAAEDVIYELDLDGRQLRSIPHPYRDLDPVPLDSPFGSSSSAIAWIHGAEPPSLYLSGGSAWDGGQRFLFQLDVESGTLIPGSEFTTAGIVQEVGSASVTLEHVRTADSEWLIALPYVIGDPTLLELDQRLPEVSAPGRLRCRQRSFDQDVELRFESNGNYDAIEIFRDCELHATISPDTQPYIDRDVPPGRHLYSVQARVGDSTSSSVRCSLVVGPGAILQREYPWPARSPQQITRDPTDGNFYVAVNWPGDERIIYRYDRGLRFVESRLSSLEVPWEIATLAARATEDERTLHLIGWQQPVPLGEAGRENFIFITESTVDGELLDWVELDPPRPTNGFVTYPTALEWIESSDTFLMLERNSRTFVELSLSGDILRTFDHPAPPYQNFVFNLGLTWAPNLERFLITGSRRHDQSVSRIFDMSPDGTLGDFELSLAGVPGVVRDIQFADGELVVVGTSTISGLSRIKAFPQIPAPFVRGDADASGVVTLSDAILTLDYLFRPGRPRPNCDDGADADDDGRLTITDPLVVLQHLFLGGIAPPEPYPESGQDPTPDGLVCQPPSGDR
ncbi:MAG: hypothetical protein AAF517_02995 [Planctomycetota bacterium]